MDPSLDSKKSTARRILLEIPARSEYVGVVRLALSGIASRMDFSVEEIEDIKISVSEACTNCVQHAYEGQQIGDVKVTCYLSKNRLEIVVEDTGAGFELSRLGTADQMETSKKKLGLGLGLTFIKSLMDEADVKSEIGKGTTVRMAKVKKVS